ncbi:MAG: adenosylcobinamide-GDP ribazoletransferase [Alphaproteobacteria bacterium]|nr:adenosylcobinamide-GDP ribazoletransferase [Alphaproteobacteria bacterium]
MQRYWQEFLFVLGFFTRLPIHRLTDVNSVEWRGRLGELSWAIPAVGAAIGLAGACVFLAASAFGLTAWLSATLAVLAQVAITGALHEDGLSDVADGFGGGATKQRKLEIMRDSRIGAYGVVAIVLALMLRAGAITDIQNVAFVLIVSGAVSRAGMVAAMAVLPSARDDGLGATAGKPGSGFFIAIGIAAGLSLILLGVDATMIAALVVFPVWFGLCKLAERQIGGQTGDVLGACQQVCELAFLIAMVGYGI